MATFMTRVELNGATGSAYDELHEKMQAVGFHRVIQGDSGQWYDLPPAEYQFFGSKSAAEVRDLAIEAAAATGFPYEIIASECLGRAWILKQI